MNGKQKAAIKAASVGSIGSKTSGKRREGPRFNGPFLEQAFCLGMKGVIHVGR